MVWLHLCLLANGSPHAKNGAVVLKEKLYGAAAFSCSEKIILSHPFLISFLWCSWCSPQWCVFHLKIDAVVLPPMVHFSPQDWCSCSSPNGVPLISRLMRLFSSQWCTSHLLTHAVGILKKILFQGCISHLKTHAVVLLKSFSRVRLSPPNSYGCSP